MSTEFSEFGTGSMDEILGQMEKDLKGQRVESPYWTPPSDKEGNFKIRFLPLLKTFNETIFYLHTKTHWINRRPYQCLNQVLIDKEGNTHEAEECPICKKVRQFYDIAGTDKNSEEFKTAGLIRARDTYISRIVVRGLKDNKGNDIETKPQFYSYGKTIFEMILNFIKSGEFGNFLSVAEGRDFNLTKSGTGRNVKYTGSYLSNPSPIFTDKAKLKELLENLKTMDYKQLIEFSTYNEMKKVVEDFLNGEKNDDEDLPNIKEDKPTKKENSKPKEEDVQTESDDEIDNLLSQF
jgi:phage FluMu protein Com